MKKKLIKMSVSDWTIPLNVVKRIINETLPKDCLECISIETDFLNALARAAHVFILISTTKANDNASTNDRRTIQPEDVITGISQLGYERFVTNLIDWHEDFMEQNKPTFKSKKRKALEERKTTSAKRMEAEESSD